MSYKDKPLALDPNTQYRLIDGEWDRRKECVRVSALERKCAWPDGGWTGLRCRPEASMDLCVCICVDPGAGLKHQWTYVSVYVYI